MCLVDTIVNEIRERIITEGVDEVIQFLQGTPGVLQSWSDRSESVRLTRDLLLSECVNLHDFDTLWLSTFATSREEISKEYEAVVQDYCEDLRATNLLKSDLKVPRLLLFLIACTFVSCDRRS